MNRTDVFTLSPQAVEYFRSGSWWSGRLLGWRHGEDGACLMWVCAGAGADGVADEPTWFALEDVRLPQPAGVAQGTPTVALSVVQVPEPATVSMGRAAGRPAPIAQGAEPDVAPTQQLRLVRDGAQGARSGRPLPPGARRHPAGRASARVAGTAAVVPAPVARPADGPPAEPGRHRAPAAPGRHRAFDTGVTPLVVVGPGTTDRSTGEADPSGALPTRDGVLSGEWPAASPASWSPPPPRSALPPPGPVVRSLPSA